MPLDHADYAERRLREDNAKLRLALEATVTQLECILAAMDYDQTPSWTEKETAREVIQRAKQAL